MIIICPECSTKFTLRPESLGAAGRDVRCSRCHTKWHQAPPPGQTFGEAPPPPPPIETFSAEIDSEMPTFIGATPDFRPMVSAAPRSRAVMIASAALAATVVLLLGALVLFRVELIGLWPATARLYAMAGWPTAYMLDIRGVNTSRSVADGGPVLVVAGEIANTSSRVQSIPRLRVDLLDGQRKVVGTLAFSPARSHLLPGESTPFETSVPNPPNEARRAMVTLIAE